jgi:NADH-quinone oxidoreductase subunit M
MIEQFPILSWIVLTPLIGVLILLLIPAQKGRLLQTITIAVTAVPLVLAGWLYTAFDHETGGMQFEEIRKWIHIPLNQEEEGLSVFQSFFVEFNYHLAIDGISMPLVFLTTLVTFLAAIASVYIAKRWKTYYILFLLLEVGMLGVFMSGDLFLFFLFFELTLIPMFFLIGIWGYFNKEKAANQFLIYNGIGSAIMLIAFLLLISTAGFMLIDNGTNTMIYYTADIQQISNNMLYDVNAFVHTLHPGNPFYMSNAMSWTLFIMLLVAFGIKLPIFPFHTWMLKVHTEAPTAIVMLHSGILLKMGAYGLIRFGILLFPDQAYSWAVVLAVLGVINILYGAILAFRQTEFKLVLAYSSISHMGIVLLGIAAMNAIGMEGAIFQLVSHGLISALLFMIVGSIYERTKTTSINELGGLARSLPFICGILLFAGMASLGLPGLSGFVSELLVFLGLFETMPIITAVAALGIILTAVYVLRAVLRISFGPIQEKHIGLRDARLAETIPMVVLAAFILLIGLYPNVLSQPIQQAVIGFDQLIHTIMMRKGG